ncbi:MAG: MarR family transcriptional regulator [Bacteroidales bacterium]|nr:MarR family transcriptional regulator [Bacteroidales bacterium]
MLFIAENVLFLHLEGGKLPLLGVFFDIELKLSFRSPNASRLLHLLQDNPYVTYAKLSEELGINISAIQKLIDGMADKGYIQRRDTDKSWLVLASSVIK